MPVIYTRVLYHPGGLDGGLFVQKVPALRGMVEGAPLAELVPELPPAAGDLVIVKQYASAFFGTGLAAFLAFRRVDTVLVAGCTTSGCVRASVVDSVSHNFRTVVATDCVGDRALGPHEANLFDMGQKYADLLTRAEIEAAW